MEESSGLNFSPGNLPELHSPRTLQQLNNPTLQQPPELFSSGGLSPMQMSPIEPFNLFMPQTQPEFLQPLFPTTVIEQRRVQPVILKTPQQFKPPQPPVFQTASARPQQSSTQTETFIPRQSQRLSMKRTGIDPNYNPQLNLFQYNVDMSRTGFVGNIEELSKANQNFRTVLYTSPNLQLVLMSLQPGEAIGSEVHPETDQFFRIESGTGIIEINGYRREYSDGTAIQVPQGSQHNLIAWTLTKLYTLYSPPHHPGDRIQARKPIE